jgi:acetyltransferase-like isoleucine patch superfamily enzyme
MRLLLKLIGPLWLRLYKLYAVRGCVTVGPRFHIGIGSMIWAPKELRIGANVYVGKLCTIECDGKIGDDVIIANAVGIIGRYDHDFRAVGVSIRNAPWIGDAQAQKKVDNVGVIIGPDVWIGYGAIILSGVRIGRGAVVGAGSVVTKDVNSYTIVAGNPARKIGTRFPTEIIRKHEDALVLAGDAETR